jgi:uncharacterized protein
MATHERRFVIDVSPAIETRADGKPRIVGKAVVYDSITTLYEGRHFVWRETVRPGAFRNALADGADVRALFNHDPNIVLGRNKSGTLEIRDTPKWLEVSIDPPDTQAGADVLKLISRGDVTGMSFAFSVRPGGEKTTTTEVEGRMVEDRELTDLDIFDVSVVTYPAYQATSVALRSSGVTDTQLAEKDRPPAPKGTPLRDKWAEWVNKTPRK